MHKIAYIPYNIYLMDNKKNHRNLKLEMLEIFSDKSEYFLFTIIVQDLKDYDLSQLKCKIN